MIFNIIFCVSFVFLLILCIINAVNEFKIHKFDDFMHDSECKDKWILCLDDCLIYCVRGDFWIGTISNKDLPFSVNCGNRPLGYYKSEEKCREVINEISLFLDDKERNVFVMP